MKQMISMETVSKRIFFIRGLKVMLDTDLAILYGVQVKALNQAVRRNIERFPTDFMFRLTPQETSLRSQSVTLKTGRGRHRKYLSYAFTEQGVAMLSSVLRSKRAIRVNIEIMRAFARLREILAANKDFARRLEELEKKFDMHDVQFRAVFDTIRELMNVPEEPVKRIGFTAEETRALYSVRRR